MKILKPAFIRKTTEKYGLELFRDLERAKTVPYLTLQSIGNKYGFSREYARQLYKKVYGEPFLPVVRAKRLAMNKDPLVCGCGPYGVVADNGSTVGKGKIGEVAVINRARKLGFDVKINSAQSGDLFINGIPVEVKASFKKTSVGQNKEYYRAKVPKSEANLSDFLIWFIGPRNKFYIIPLPCNCGPTIYMSKKMDKYEGAWHLLHDYQSDQTGHKGGI